MLCNLFYLTPFISRPEHPKQGRRYRSNIALKKRLLAMPYQKRSHIRIWRGVGDVRNFGFTPFCHWVRRDIDMIGAA